MYNITVHAQQILGASLCAVSLTETSDEGFTYPLATAMSSSNLLASADEDPLWLFLEQVKDCLSRALGSDSGLWSQVSESAAMDGGWGGAGSPGQPERSEDEC